jgi:SnoaL-like domain
MVADENKALRQLLDKDSICDVVRRYSYCVDHRLYDEVIELFTEDCIVDYGPGNGPPVRSQVALRQLFGHPDGGFEATSHHNANIFVTFVGENNATVRTSVYAWHKQSDGRTPKLWGYYHDSLVRTPEGWRIAKRQLRVLGIEDWHTKWHWELDSELKELE